METRFTPGPWKICIPMNPDRAYGIEAHDDAEGPDGEATQCVAEICDGSPEVAVADARLIAAAPDLFAACEQALQDAIDLQEEKDHLGEDFNTVKILKAALAKARGESAA